MTYRREKPIIYVAGPYRGKSPWDVEQNIREAEERAFNIAYLSATPLCPHSMFRYFDGTLTDKYWLRATMDLLSVCDAIEIDYGWKRSKGTLAEVDFARANGIQVIESQQALAHYIQKWSGE